MPEPITATLVSVTVVSVAVYVYKSIDRLVSAPKELAKQTVQSAEELIKTFGAELRRLFGSEPRISIQRRVIQQGGAAIQELALYKESILINEEWADTNWRSTKTLRVQQPFTLKAGFDLNRLKFELDVANRLVTVTISDSTIVSVEYAGEYEILKEEHGFWNRISTAERDAIINSLPVKAQEEAEKLQLREKAVKQLEGFLRRVLDPGLKLVIHCADETICFKDNEPLPGIPERTLSALGLKEESLRV